MSDFGIVVCLQRTDREMAVNTTNQTSGNHQTFFHTLFSFRLHDILQWYTKGSLPSETGLLYG